MLTPGQFELRPLLSAGASIHSSIQFEQYLSSLDKVLNNAPERLLELASAQDGKRQLLSTKDYPRFTNSWPAIASENSAGNVPNTSPAREATRRIKGDEPLQSPA